MGPLCTTIYYLRIYFADQISLSLSLCTDFSNLKQLNVIKVEYSNISIKIS